MSWFLKHFRRNTPNPVVNTVPVDDRWHIISTSAKVMLEFIKAYQWMMINENGHQELIKFLNILRKVGVVDQLDENACTYCPKNAIAIIESQGVFNRQSIIMEIDNILPELHQMKLDTGIRQSVHLALIKRADADTYNAFSIALKKLADEIIKE